MSQKRGRLITFEGGEGAGKSTQMERIAHYLRQEQIEVITTREPGGTPLGEKIRTLLLNEPMGAKAELLLLFAARAEHLRQVIEPALAQGKWVLSDRFTESSYAYQGYGRGLPIAEIATLEALTLGDLRPDRTYWFDLPLEVGFERVGKRGATDRFEEEERSFFEAVTRGFETLLQQRPHQFRHIDATQSIAAVEGAIIADLKNLLPTKAESLR